MRRKFFLAGAGSLGIALSVRGRAFGLSSSGTAGSAASTQTVRVRIFNSMDFDHVVVSSDASLTASTGDQTFRGQSAYRLDDLTVETAITSSSPLTVTAYFPGGKSVARRYLGSLKTFRIHGKLTLVNVVDLEPYVASVLASEISARWHTEALKAQAIAVRTYALRRIRKPRSPSYDLADDTSNQVYRGLDGINLTLADAATATAGLVATVDGAPADIWYHSACGGHTAAAEEVTGNAGPSYLQGIPDLDASGRAYCADTPYYKWRNSIAASSLARVLDVGASALAGFSIVDRWPDGRARTVRAALTSGAVSIMDGHEFYGRAASVLGYKVVPSAMFEVSADAGQSYAFTGHGVGHGVGMCQWGAQGRALQGAPASEILAAYFPGATVADLTN